MGQIAVGSPMSVDNDQFEILIPGQKPGHVPANPTKPVQSNPDSHYVSPLFLSQIVTQFFSGPTVLRTGKPGPSIVPSAVEDPL
jgi:hypothetical protein